MDKYDDGMVDFLGEPRKRQTPDPGPGGKDLALIQAGSARKAPVTAKAPLKMPQGLKRAHEESSTEKKFDTPALKKYKHGAEQAPIFKGMFKNQKIKVTASDRIDHEIMHDWRTTSRILPSSVMAALIKEVMQNVVGFYDPRKANRMQRQALNTIITVVEFMLSVLTATNLMARHAGRQTITT